MSQQSDLFKHHGGLKYDSGKVMLSLVPSDAIRGIARVFMFGAKKYKAWNWTLGMSVIESTSAAKRHIEDFLEGIDENDCAPDSKLPHLDHAITMLIITRENIRRLGDKVDDRLHKLSNEDLQLSPEEIAERVALYEVAAKGEALSSSKPETAKISASRGGNRALELAEEIKHTWSS